MSSPAEIKQKNKLSLIWFLPIMSLLVACWMLYKYQMEQGEVIYIKMPSAEGIINGKTEIKVRSVKIGIISHTRLSDDQKSVIARAEIDNHYVHLLTQDAKLWVVKPRIDETGITGMTTLLSGVYIEFLPGTDKDTIHQFQLLTDPPLIPNDIEGGRVKLLSRDAEVIDVGTGVFYKGFKVGQVETATFDWQEQTMRYGLFIQAPYQNLITLNSVFWVHSGIEVDLNADGISIKTGSLSKILKGGISFTVPEREKPGEIAQDGHIFSLSDDYKTALEQRYYEHDYYVIEFEQSIRGLRVGAPVEYRGTRVGTVVEAPAILVVDGKPAHFMSDNTAVPVMIKIEYRRLYHEAKVAKEFWQSNSQKWIDNGLRASLKPGNLLTGAVYVDLDFYPDAEQKQPKMLANYRVFPSISSGFSVLTNQLSEVMAKINKLDVEKTLVQLNSTVAEYEKLAADLRVFVNQSKTQQIPAELSQSLDKITSSMSQFDRTMKQFAKTMADYQQGSPVYHDMNRAVEEMKKLAEQLQPLGKSLNEQPNMLIFDKKPIEDLQPRSKQND
ncbi:intermembrane transport protein PqiB [Pseudoalteromonas tunicata]|uniref:intermembrane transport protein PqiB n=1 Tax=Pseudoalteromonas tunicata TaxID=314281 RepID=UPI00273FBC1E|nr:intermembrane transport protein PqiB [Pseudoalteromonas tunicata]MDP4983968.1 intermembrane transport protein PqiB [Pseudoalteromonas tunicata]MDP5213913.1 intermembrane transport protein PqiB [Pseudoalteromonas tunicata]